MTRHRAFGLYILVLVFVFISFVLGLMIGTGSVEQAEQQPGVSPYPAAENLDDTQLDFYEELSKPIEEDEPEISLKKEPDSKPAPEAEKQERTPAKSKESARLTIQVAAYSSKEEAEQLITRLSAKGFYGRIREPDPASGDKYFRVWVGDFSSSSEADDHAMLLKEEGFHTYIRKTR
jgi:cell division protein FtsN